MDYSARQSLVGSWIVRDGEVFLDEVALEIERRLRDELIKIASSTDGWSSLLIDDSKNEYWELTYPQSEMHGGGPKTLSPISRGCAGSKYSF